MSVTSVRIDLAADLESGAHVVAVGGDDVFGRHVLAVMEGDALAEREDPGLGIVRRLEGSRPDRARLRPWRSSRSGCCHGAPAHGAGELVGIGRRVQRIRGRAMADAHAERAALLGLGARGLANIVWAAAACSSLLSSQTTIRRRRKRQLDELAARGPSRGRPASRARTSVLPPCSQTSKLPSFEFRQKRSLPPLPCAGGWIFFVEAKPAVFPHQLVGPPCVSVLVCFRCVAPDLARSARVSGTLSRTLGPVNLSLRHSSTAS